MTFKEKDFVKVELDLYANGKLVQTTNEKKGKEAKLENKSYEPQALILGNAFILKALDDHILKATKNEERTLKLNAEQAYGKRKKELIKTFPKSAFDEHKLRAVPGVTYDFNGMYGTVKSVVGGRILVDFNNPLSGKEIDINYKVVKTIVEIEEKLAIVFENVLRIPQETFKIEIKEKNLTLNVPKQLMILKSQLLKSIEEFIPEIKDYKVELKELKLKE